MTQQQPILSQMQQDILSILEDNGCTSLQYRMNADDLISPLSQCGYDVPQILDSLNQEIDVLIAQGLVGEVPHNRLSRYIYKI